MDRIRPRWAMGCVLSAAFFSMPFSIRDARAQATLLELPQPQERRQVKVMINGREVAIHHSGPALDKSYIHPLWTPDRRCITYDAPADHIHHRALCVGWPDVSGVDFWAEINSPKGRRGRMIPYELVPGRTPDGGATIRESNNWVREDGAVLVKEKRDWRFLPPRGNLQIVDVDIALTAAASEVVFGSDPKKPREYHGLTIRLGPFDKPRFYNSEGAEGWEKCHGKPARWVALSGIQSGRPVTAAILDHPENDSHPTRFFVLGQGMQFISTSPNFTKPKILKQNETWRLRYRVIAAGAPAEGQTWNLDDLWKELGEKNPNRDQKD